MSETTAYSYIRFSSDRQQHGDSLHRQRAATVELCKRRDWTLDDSLTFRDLGVSAFKGTNVKVWFKDGKSGGVIIGGREEYQPYFFDEERQLMYDLRKYRGWYDDEELRGEVLSGRGFR